MKASLFAKSNLKAVLESEDRDLGCASLLLLRFLFVSIALLLFCGCSSESDDVAEIREKCRRIDSDCASNCVSRKFSTCYVDTVMFPKGPYDMVTHCYGTHVGDMCAPCNHRFSLNFGGVFREISCEEFLAGIRRKNRSCGDCLSKYGESPFEF